MRALIGLVLPCASHSGEIALADSHRPRSSLVAAPVLVTRAGLTRSVTSGYTAAVTIDCAGYHG
jgi:hypothetical protein